MLWLSGAVQNPRSRALGRIAERGINVREHFTITKRWGGRRDSQVAWEVARLAPNASPRKARWWRKAWRWWNAYAAILEYGLPTYGGRIKPDEIRRSHNQCLYSAPPAFERCCKKRMVEGSAVPATLRNRIVKTNEFRQA